MGKIVVNGKLQEQETPLLLSELIRLNNVQNPEMVSVQVNGAFVDRTAFGLTELSEGDEVDFLYFMGGGSRC
ncbi:MAG: sulfur carrier protein ThiS [Marinilabiliales bacterium]|nr:sulfur carrier protein ThiS [Marinilabiliales bacterium]